MRGTAVRAGTLALVVYGALFALLGVDTAVRVWLARSVFETPLDAGLLIVYEGMRVLTVGLALVAATALGLRGARHAGAGLTAVLLVMLAVAFAKATSYDAFPGLVQERVARALLARGTPIGLLEFVFGQPMWALGLAAAAFLRLAVVFPAAVTAEAVEEAGSRDRRGMLRGHALAGTDVGAFARRLTAAALRSGLLGPLPVWTVALGLALANATGIGVISGAASLLAVGVPLLLGIPALRAGLALAGAADRARILWFVEAAFLAGLAVVVGGILSAVPGDALAWLSFAVLALAPMVVLLCLMTAIAPAGGVEPERALRFTAHWGAMVVAAVTAASVVEAALMPVLGTMAAVRAAAALAAGIVAALSIRALLRARPANPGWLFRLAGAGR